MKNKVMGRAVLGFGFAWVLAIAATAFSLSGCANDPVENRETKVGTIDLALSGTSASGVAYRLRDAQINIVGAASSSLTTEDYLDQDQISLELPEGGYIAALDEGWRLERLVDGMFADVPAILISTNPLPFTVVDQQTTDVRLRFRAGDDVVELGNGRVLIGIDVLDESAPPPEDCLQTCYVALSLNCGLQDECWRVCGFFQELAVGTMCEPLTFDYMACAQDEPGETYICGPSGVPIAAACEPEFLAAATCIVTAPPPACDVDEDTDGYCQNQGDCDDSDPNVHPGAMDLCGDPIDQNCDGFHPPCPPDTWTCDPNLFGGNDGCDCGCGQTDPDCVSVGIGSCDFCNEMGSCDEGPGCTAIDPDDNAVCFQ